MGNQRKKDTCEVFCINQKKVDAVRKVMQTDGVVKKLVQTFKVLGDDYSKNTSLDFNTRKQHIWWGPQDINGDGKVDDADAQLVLNAVVWINDETGKPINLNEGAKNYHVYDYECPWGCCWVSTSITNAPAQYLGYVPY